MNEDEPSTKQKVYSNLSKWNSTNKERYDRPGRAYKAEKKYTRNKTHCGKGKTLRDHR